MDAVSAIVSGIKLVSKVISTTYGPGGKPAALDRAAGLTWTRDGLTVVREIRPGGVAQLGVDLVLEACTKTNERAGDGTSATCLVAARASQEALRWIRGGVDPMLLGRQMRKAALQVVGELGRVATPIDTYDQVELIGLRASGGDVEAARGIRQALEGAGIGGTVVVEAGMSRGVEIQFLEGLLVRAGARAKDQIPPDGERSMEEPFVVVSMVPLRTEADVIPILTAGANLDKTLMIFAPQVEGGALATILLNDSKKVARAIAVEVPGNEIWRERNLRDIAAVSAATPIDPLMGRGTDRFDINWFGLVRHGSVTYQRTVLVPIEQDSTEIRLRIQQIEEEASRSTSEYDRDRHAERISCLSGALCTVRIGGVTESEARERRTRVEDAVRACQGAIERGFVAGGGVGYFRASQTLLGMEPGQLVVRSALSSPIRTIADQLHLSWEEALEKIEKEGSGWTGVESFDSILAVEEATLNGIEAAATAIECRVALLAPGRAS